MSTQLTERSERKLLLYVAPACRQAGIYTGSVGQVDRESVFQFKGEVAEQLLKDDGFTQNRKFG